jgi:hypothetical protein
VGKEIVVTGVSAGSVEISATIGTNISKFTLDIQAAAVPTKVVGVKDFATKYEQGATAQLSFANILVKDQYNRDYTLKNGDVVTVVAKDGTANAVTFSLTSGTAPFNDTADMYTFTGTNVTDNEVYTISINGVAGSGFDVTLNSVLTTSITTYEVRPVGTIYAHSSNAATTTHRVTINIIGKTASGDSVALIDGKITQITSSNAAVVNIDNSNKTIWGLTAGTATIGVWNNATKLAEIAVTTSTVAPRIASVSFENATVNKLTNAAAFTNTITVKDQYGVNAIGGTFSSSNTAVATVSSTGVVTIIGVGEATIGYVAPSGVVATYKLIVQ